MTEPSPVAIQRLLLHVPNRRRVYEAVIALPGTHPRRLSRELSMALGSVEHHVRVLERHGVVYTLREGRRRTVFAVGQVAPSDAPVIDALRKPAWARLLAELNDQGEAGVAALAMRLGLPPTTVSYHLRRLKERGLLEHVRIGRESVYFVAEPDQVSRLLSEVRPAGNGHGPDAAFQGVVARAARRPAVRGPGMVRTVRGKD